MLQYTIDCPSCNQSFLASGEHTGQQTQCQNCMAYFTVPSYAEVAALTTAIAPMQTAPAAQAGALVSKWNKTLTIMGPLCALLLLLGGGVVYWIINNKTVTTEKNRYQKEVITEVKEPSPPPVIQEEEIIENVVANEKPKKRPHTDFNNTTTNSKDILDRVTLQEVRFSEGTTLRQAIHFLRLRTRKLSKNKNTPNILFIDPAGAQGSAPIEGIKIGELLFKNVSASDVLKQVTAKTGCIAIYGKNSIIIRRAPLKTQ